jgi:hypothetical protein
MYAGDIGRTLAGMARLSRPEQIPALVTTGGRNSSPSQRIFAAAKQPKTLAILHGFNHSALSRTHRGMMVTGAELCARAVEMQPRLPALSHAHWLGQLRISSHYFSNPN